MDKILRDAVQEILSNERNAAVDDWLSVKSPELHTSKNFAESLFSENTWFLVVIYRLKGI